ncbi:MAG: glycosyltransferase family 4 protein [Nitrosarchaeum sp.]|nr:glycosyltransferase family 4 protein [Nitrosarchaeum sp.]
MNVLLVSQFFSTTKGGGEYVFKTIAELLAQNGHKVWVITNNVRGEKYQESENLKIVRVGPTLQYKGGIPPTFLDNIRYAINAFQKGISIIRNHRIEIIHSNNFSPALAGSMLSYFTRTPHITTIHDIFSIYDDKFWKKWQEQSDVSHTNARLVPFFEKMMMRFKIDCIHTVSEATKKDIEKIGTKKPICIIPNCIQDQGTITIPKKKGQFVYVGRLVFYKNIEVILKAFGIVAKEFPDAELIIAGDGPHRKALQETAKKIACNVTFAGYVTPDEKKRLFAESNALLFPSLIEGFGLVILEAFQQKRPVLASDMPPMSDIVEDQKTGYLIDPHDEKKWAEKIIQLIKDPDTSDQMGENGYHTMREKYSQKTFYDKLSDMYQSVL